MVRKLTRKECRGVVAVEFALVLPLLLLLTMGAIRYGYFFLKAQQITNAARHGARTAARSGASIAGVTLAIDGLMTAAGMSGMYNVTFNPPDPAVPTVGQPVTVLITVAAADIDVMPVPLFTIMDPNGWMIGARVTMAKEGF